MAFEDVSTAPGPPTGHRSTGSRVAVSLAGLAAIVIGIVLLLNPVTAVRSLALLISLALVVGGLLEMVSSRYRHRWVGPALGVVLILGGFVAVFWPGLALWPLAIIVGIDLIVHGLLRIVIVARERRELAHWGWLLTAGVFNVFFGVAALAWPRATVAVLAILLGAQILIFGVVALVLGLVPGRHGHRTGHHAGPRPAPAG